MDWQVCDRCAAGLSDGDQLEIGAKVMGKRIYFLALWGFEGWESEIRSMK